MKKIIALILACAGIVVSIVLFSSFTNKSASEQEITIPEDANAIQASAVIDEKHGQYESGEERIATMKLAASDGGMELYYDDAYAEIALKDTVSGMMWFSNPYDYNLDSSADESTKTYLDSILKLYYFDSKGNGSYFNSYNDCVNKEERQFTIKKLENGIRFNMTIGQKDKALLVPVATEATNFEEKVLKNLDEKSIRKLNTYYTRISMNDAKLSESVLQGYKKNYPGLEEHDFYILRNSTAREKKILDEIFRATGYTEEDYNRDQELSGYQNANDSSASFYIPIEFMLENGELVVNVPADEIVYEKDKWFLSKITVCQYLGAGKSEEGGYLFLPDGSGSLLEYNKDRQKTILNMECKIYGQDYGADNVWTYNSLTQQAYFPVFGNKQQKKALFAVIEEGDATASTFSESGNIISSYETVYPVFNYNTTLTVEYKENSKVMGMYTYHSKDNYEGNYRIRYSFLEGKQADYAGMAAYYRNYLENKGILTRNENLKPKLYVEALGSIEKKDTVMGIVYNKMVPLTTFQQAQDMATELKSSGVDQIALSYRGWMNGGLDSGVPSKIEPEKVLGGKKGLKALMDYTKSEGIGFFPDVDFFVVRRDEKFDGYSHTTDAPRTLSRTSVYLAPPEEITTTWFYQNYAISPKKYADYIEGFFDIYKKYQIPSVSIGNLGSMLYADYNTKAGMERQKVIGTLRESLNSNLDGDYRLLMNGANAYSLDYATDVVRIPTSDSQRTVSDEAIPFVQMVLHGYISYASMPVNLSVDESDMLLKNLEYGANPMYTVAYAQADELQDTGYTLYYSVDYAYWKESMEKAYQEYATVYQDIAGLLMVAHEKLQEGVFRTIYEDGTSIVVNYNDTAVKTNYGMVEAKNYLLKRGDQ